MKGSWKGRLQRTLHKNTDNRLSIAVSLALAVGIDIEWTGLRKKSR